MGLFQCIWYKAKLCAIARGWIAAGYVNLPMDVFIRLFLIYLLVSQSLFWNKISSKELKIKVLRIKVKQQQQRKVKIQTKENTKGTHSSRHRTASADCGGDGMGRSWFPLMERWHYWGSEFTLLMFLFTPSWKRGASNSLNRVYEYKVCHSNFGGSVKTPWLVATDWPLFHESI